MSFRQEMPPKGGYAPFEFINKNKPRWITGKGKWLFGGFAVYSVAILQYYMFMYRKYIRASEIENRDANIAMEPIFVAERNRMFLKRLIDNNEYEKEIMKDTPGWIPGTWYGSPIYHSKQWTDPNEEEFWAHAHPRTYYNQRMERHKH